jgi:hypothetical protein
VFTGPVRVHVPGTGQGIDLRSAYEIRAIETNVAFAARLDDLNIFLNGPDYSGRLDLLPDLEVEFIMGGKLQKEPSIFAVERMVGLLLKQEIAFEEAPQFVEAGEHCILSFNTFADPLRLMALSCLFSAGKMYQVVAGIGSGPENNNWMLASAGDTIPLNSARSFIQRIDEVRVKIRDPREYRSNNPLEDQYLKEHFEFNRGDTPILKGVFNINTFLQEAWPSIVVWHIKDKGSIEEALNIPSRIESLLQGIGD